MNLLSDVLTYIRRIIKSPSNASISDDLLIDYVNRFWIMDVDARLQLFDLKTRYAFQTTPGVDQYNMPLYDIQTQPGSQAISSYPVYQGFLGPSYVNGVEVAFQTQKDNFFRNYPNIVQNLQAVGVGNGLSNPYTLNVPLLANTIPSPNNPPLQGLLRGHVDISGVISTGTNVDPPVYNNATAIVKVPQIPTTSIMPAIYITSIAADGSPVVVTDSGVFLQGNVNYGLLIEPGNAPLGNQVLPAVSGVNYSTSINTINYFTGVINVSFPVIIPAGNNINVQCYYFQTGLPRTILYYNNTLTLRSPPDKAYLVELDAYLTPAAFLSTGAALPFGYMAEYLARGAARKILSDTGDVEQFQFYEPLFREQELLVWKRSQRQWTATRTQTIYSSGYNQGLGATNLGGFTP